MFADEIDGIPGDADIYLLGEIHDDAAHHLRQAEIVERLSPTTLVFEMLPDTFQLDATKRPVGDANALDTALGWSSGGWPDFALYHPIFQAAPDAHIVGMAPPEDEVRQAIEDGAAQVFGADAAQFGLTDALDPKEQSNREKLQDEVHCNALPAELLPGFVEAQRFRDARFALATLKALQTYGSPVAVITGNGHVVLWGMPRALELAAPEVKTVAVSQLYGEAKAGGADIVLRSAAPPQSSDPCASFQSK